MAGLQPVDAEAQEEDDAERSEEQHDHPGAAVDRLAERRQAGEPSVHIGDGGGIVGQPGDDAGQGDAGGHVIVDADHVGAQTHIDFGGTRSADAAGSYVTVIVRHRSFLSLSRAGLGRRAQDVNLGCVECLRQIWLYDDQHHCGSLTPAIIRQLGSGDTGKKL